jgi:hypothetical protein
MIPQLITGLFAPVANIFAAREARKAAKEQATAKLLAAKSAGALSVELNKDEYEMLATSGLNHTWKDEYATVSILSIFNLIVLGGVLAAFGAPSLLEGVGVAVTALHELGVDVGFLLEAVVLAAVGLSVWKRV